jgi:hypothetical protein
MDELKVVREFRAGAAPAAEAREQARRRLETVVAGVRPRPRRRLLLLAVAAVLVVVGAGTAYALARDFLVGDPAPPEVKEQAAALNEVKGELIPRLRSGPRIRVEETRLAAVLEASTGPVYLWVAPNERSDDCLFMQIVGTELPDGRPNLGGGCSGGSGKAIDWSFRATRVRDGRLVVLLSGTVGDDVAGLELTSDGETRRIPLQGRFFLVELSGGGDRPIPQIPSIELVAYDASGRELAREKGRPSFLRRAFNPPQPPDLTQQKPLLEILTRKTGKPIKLYVFERKGERCRVLVSPRGTGSDCGGPRPAPRDIWVAPNQIGAAPKGMLLLWGEVGSEIERLELRFEDGRVEPLPLVQRFTLYQVAPEDFAAGRRPIVLVGRDGDGEVVGERKLGPWRS